MKQNIRAKLDELGINFLNIDFDNPPEEITYEMLEAEMDNNSLDFVADRRTLWRAWSRTMVNPHPFGLYSEENIMNTKKRAQFLKDIEASLKKSTTKTIKDKPLKKLKYEGENIYGNKYEMLQQQPTQIAVAAGGRTLSKKRKNNKTKKRNKSHKKTTYKKYHGGRHDSFGTADYTSILIQPTPKENYNPVNEPPVSTFLHLVESTLLPNLHGTQLPNQFDILSMTRMFMYLMYTKEIDYLIDLQACHLPNSNPPHPTFPTRGCNPNKLDVEINTWKRIKDLFQDTRNNTNIGSSHIPYLDMTAGNHNVWGEIRNLPDMNQIKSVVHCLAGFGRTGSVMIFLTLRDYAPYATQVRDNINVPFWGMTGDEWVLFINQALPDVNQQREFWNYKDYYHAKLLVTRINYIIYNLAKRWGKTTVVAYQSIPATWVPGSQVFFPVSVNVVVLKTGL